MNSQLFFFLNLAAGAFFIWWFLSGRKGRGARGTKLNMKPGGAPPPPFPQPPPPNAPVRQPPPPPPDLFSGNRREEKLLNVRFVYNGHDWDAFEVLGLPAGAKLSTVTQRYQELLRTADRGQLEFYEAAYQAILKKV